eukprot:scaffold8960_cov91-Cylindrotheca_fusiformis.AAC.2
MSDDRTQRGDFLQVGAMIWSVINKHAFGIGAGNIGHTLPSVCPAVFPANMSVQNVEVISSYRRSIL